MTYFTQAIWAFTEMKSTKFIDTMASDDDYKETEYGQNKTNKIGTDKQKRETFKQLLFN